MLRELLQVLWLGVVSVSVSAKCKFVSTDTSLRSLEEVGREVEIMFSNPGEGEFDIFWVNGFMKEVHMGMLGPWAEMGYYTNEGMAWRIKLHGTSLAVLEYIIDSPLKEPLILNSDRQPLLALTVGEGCTTEDLDSTISGDVKDHLKLFTSDKKPLPSRRRSINATYDDEYFEVAFDLYSDEVQTGEMLPPVDEVEIDQKVSDCPQAELWLNKHVSVEGYHVICIAKLPHLDELTHPHVPGISYMAGAWHEGYMNLPNEEVFHASTMLEFRSQIEKLFSFRRTDEWRVQSEELIHQRSLSRDGSSKWAFLPQRWRMFNEFRQPVESLYDIQDQQVLLIFEGGQFIYPGVDINFERVVNLEGSDFIIKTLSMRPLLLQVDNLLKAEECEYMIDYSRPLMTPSEVSLMDRDAGKPATDFRTSQYVFMTTSSHKVLQGIDRRIANITGLDIRNQEDAQILKYEVGNYYLSHTDYWNPSFYQSPDMMQMTQAGHKNRLATVFWYMNSDVEGGCTSFVHAPLHNDFYAQTIGNLNVSEQLVDKEPIQSDDPLIQDVIDCNYGLKVAPKRGRAIIFYSLLPSGNGDDYSEHAACAVTGGTKWAANKWVWNQFR